MMAEVGARWPQIGPTGLQDGPKIGSLTASRATKTKKIVIFQRFFNDSRHCEMAQDGPKMSPRWPQDGPKMAQDGPRMVSRWPQDGSKMAPSNFKMALWLRRRPQPTTDDPTTMAEYAADLWVSHYEFPRGAESPVHAGPGRPQRRNAEVITFS